MALAMVLKRGASSASLSASPQDKKKGGKLETVQQLAARKIRETLTELKDISDVKMVEGKTLRKALEDHITKLRSGALLEPLGKNLYDQLRAKYRDDASVHRMLGGPRDAAVATGEGTGSASSGGMEGISDLCMKVAPVSRQLVPSRLGGLEA